MIASKPTPFEAATFATDKRSAMFPVPAVDIDLRAAFREMKGCPSRNLKYMRDLAATWTDRQVVQEGLAQVIWYQPVGVAEWVSQFTHALPNELKGSLPTIEQIEDSDE